MPQTIVCRKTRRPRPGHAGFTLVEILIVVVILGILAAIVIPQFVSAASESREGSMKMDLSRIRQQLEIYRQHHDGKYPTLEGFVDQLTKPSNDLGETADARSPSYPRGPYIRSVPKNPNNDLKTVTDGEAGSSGWYYNEETGDFRANDSLVSRTY